MEFFRNAIRRIIRLFIRSPEPFRMRGYYVPSVYNPNAPDAYRSRSEFLDGEW